MWCAQEEEEIILPFASDRGIVDTKAGRQRLSREESGFGILGLDRYWGGGTVGWGRVGVKGE